MSRASIAWAALLIAAVSGAAASLLVGAGNLEDEQLGALFLRLRASRLATSFIAGAALGTAGVLVQGLFRNPLASPSVLGTTAGASFGGTVAIIASAPLAPVLGDQFPRELLVPLGCLLGAIGALLVLLAVAKRTSNSLTLLLTGFVLSSLFLSAAGLLSSLAQETWQLGRAVVAFTLGGVDGKGAGHVGLALPLLLAGLAAALGWRRHLDLMLSGEEEARSLGVDVSVVRLWVIIWTAVLTSAAVSIGGSVSFVGLVVPHLLRPFVGHEHGRLLPAAFFGGGVFLVWADVLARCTPTMGELPLGVVTGFVGAPLFLYLLLRDSRHGEQA